MKFFNLLLLTLSISLSVYAQDYVVNITVTEKGFVPSKIDVSTASPVLLKITRTTNNTCSTSIQIPSHKIKKDLPLNIPIEIKLGKLEKGEIKFGCGMNMMDSGKIYVK
jgi:plastocyanin domain-containing protein